MPDRPIIASLSDGQRCYANDLARELAIQIFEVFKDDGFNADDKGTLIMFSAVAMLAATQMRLHYPNNPDLQRRVNDWLHATIVTMIE